MSKCANCPMREVGEECYGEKAKICFLLDPDDPRYNPSYHGVIVKQSLVAAGLTSNEPPDFDKGPGWLRDAMAKDDGPKQPPAPSEPQKMPSLFQQAKNFIGSAVQHVAHGMPPASSEEVSRRLSICAKCPYLSTDRRCMKCGCPVDTKATWALEHCPDTPPRWGPEQPKSKQAQVVTPPKSKGGCNCGKQ